MDEFFYFVELDQEYEKNSEKDRVKEDCEKLDPLFRAYVKENFKEYESVIIIQLELQEEQKQEEAPRPFVKESDFETFLKHCLEFQYQNKELAIKQQYFEGKGVILINLKRMLASGEIVTKTNMMFNIKGAESLALKMKNACEEQLIDKFKDGFYLTNFCCIGFKELSQPWPSNFISKSNPEGTILLELHQEAQACKIQCDGCNQPIEDKRFKSADQLDFDLCEACFNLRTDGNWMEFTKETEWRVLSYIKAKL